MNYRSGFNMFSHLQELWFWYLEFYLIKGFHLSFIFLFPLFCLMSTYDEFRFLSV
jgi:hypothetical protein